VWILLSDNKMKLYFWSPASIHLFRQAAVRFLMLLHVRLFS
jgi:hypothetical protein